MNPSFFEKYLHLTNIGDSLPDGVFVCDTEGSIMYVNQANEALTGIPREQCVGKNISAFTSEGGISNVVAQQVLKTKSSYSSLAISPLTNIQLLETGMPLFDEEQRLVGVVIIDRDISQMTQMTQLLKQSESKIARFREITRQNELVMNRLMEQHMEEQMKFSRNVQPQSTVMQETYRLAYQAAATNVTVLLTGETGVGKEVIANYIYTNSLRKDKPFIKVNCAAIPANLLESELFGYVKGAFTGADSKGKTGMFELADKGTLFLDEIGELPLDFQAKLLRALQQHEISPVGSTKTIKLDIRIIAATNRDLAKMVDEEKFRSDLYYRLNIFPIGIPALRERKEDIIPMLTHFLQLFNRRYNKNIMFSQDAIEHMAEYTWPGNIRELENIIERWVVIYDEFETLTWNQIASYFPEELSPPPTANDYLGKSLKEIIQQTEYDTFRWALRTYRTSRGIAKALGIDHSTVVRKIHALGLSLAGGRQK